MSCGVVPPLLHCERPAILVCEIILTKRKPSLVQLSRPVLQLAKWNATYHYMIGHMVRTSAYPFPWILGDFPNVGYYEHENLPEKVDADFLLVQKDRIKDVEPKLHESYFTEPLTIRPYQDTSKLYLNAKTFRALFPSRVPNFQGNASP